MSTTRLSFLANPHPKVTSVMFRMLVWGLIFVPRVQEVLSLLRYAWAGKADTNMHAQIEALKSSYKKFAIRWTVSHPLLARRYVKRALEVVRWIKWLLPMVISARKVGTLTLTLTRS